MVSLVRRGLETLVVPFDAGEVTRVASEDEPRAAGLERADVDAMWASVVAAYRTGLYPALALCVRRRGRVVIDRSIGHVVGNAPGDPRDAYRVIATPRTMFNLFSASKMVTAMLIHLCDQRGLVHLDDPVAHYIPEFGAHGKHRITLRHVLTHRDVRAFLKREVLAPLGFDGFEFGVPAARMKDVAQNAFTGPPVVPPLAQVIKRALSVDFHDAVRISNDPRFLQAIIPAGNIIATANEASRFMQLLVGGGALDGVRVFEERTITRAVAETSYLEVDLTLGAPVRYSMGFMLGGRYASVYGMHTPRAFGHLGFTNVVVYADPDRELAVALMTSGKPALSPGLARWLWIMQTIAKRCPRSVTRRG